MTEHKLSLYTFRRCPYAMRARLALALAEIPYEHREVSLKEKPEHLLEISPKGTVPVLFGPEIFIEESLDIMLWAFNKNDPQTCFPSEAKKLDEQLQLIKRNDTEFKKALDQCKYSIRFSEEEVAKAKEKAFSFLKSLEETLKTQLFLSGDKRGFLDCALFPFVRQFSRIKPDVIGALEAPKLKAWLEAFDASPLFQSIMKKQALWKKET